MTSFEEMANKIRSSAPEEMRQIFVTVEDLLNLERAIGLELPTSFKLFLKEFGYVDWPVVIYGIGSGGMPGDKLLSVCMRERKEMLPAMPTHIIPFSPDGLGNHYCFDLSRMAAGEAPVVFWDHQAGEHQVPNQAAPSFVNWLEAALEAELHPEESNDAYSLIPDGPVKPLPIEKLGYRPSRRGTPPYDREGYRIELHEACDDDGPYFEEFCQRDHRGV